MIDRKYHYWGKTSPSDETEAEPFHLLVYHSLDVAAVGRALLESRRELSRRLSKLMGMPEEDAKVWCVFLLGLHDLGKFAESFQQLREDLRLAFWPAEKIRKRNYSIRHDALGWMLWQQFLSKRLFHPDDEAWRDLIDSTMNFWLAAVTGHHGWPPDKPDQRERIKSHFRDFDQQAALDFYKEWRDLIRPDVSNLKRYLNDPDFTQCQRRASWLLAGIAVLADWLGSDSERFPFHGKRMRLETYWQDHALPAAEKAVQAAGILPPPVRQMHNPGDLFSYLNHPTPLQKACLDIPLGDGPQLFILEDVTGAGKTEAALILAARLMTAGQGQGLYIGLPTMATANAMYKRMATVYRKLYQLGEPTPSLILSHGARHLSTDFQQSLLAAHAGGDGYGDEESIVAQCNRWLADNRKKALLADVGIGTIDQALLAVMPARHQSLRLLGLVGKVLILDEVHAYDAYTSEPLKRLIRFHAALGGSVVLLSATLTREQRQQLVGAFQESSIPALRSGNYPLLTHATLDKVVAEQPVATRSSVARRVDVTLLKDESAVFDHICQAFDAGECVCWIRNTVADARDAWRQLRDMSWLNNNHLHLFHSRYALCDRLRIEQEMLDRFGKDSTPEQRRGRVLIATQVVEQSLDLDFDRMISDLAPIDLLIQRAGRLHRHQRGKRGTPLLYVISPPLDKKPKADWYKGLFPKAHYVYPDTLVLWRTAMRLSENGGWRMPEDARDLLEFVYDNGGDIPPDLMDAKTEVDGTAFSERGAGQFSSLWLDSGYRGNPQWDEEARIATRLGDENRTVYLARWEDEELRPWADEGRYRWDLSSLRVNVNQLSKLAPLEDTVLRESLDQLREHEKLFDEESFILPLVKDGHTWRAFGQDKSGQKVLVDYDPDVGLEINGMT
ncbi:MAG TPA: CRISPR-associated helicase Cas3' [Gammaproteobacteria bacterium]|nr:CRISPR-associated helicase Cas3' [Gammaproteobacteria bacterium]